ncbi:MAG TPA: hypothetical protein VMQ44_01990 [Candidatus Saccharimonadales bacterium]|nr:hypothetical protein [Candidatus Saccharimonadales bacterium]
MLGFAQVLTAEVNGSRHFLIHAGCSDVFADITSEEDYKAWRGNVNARQIGDVDLPPSTIANVLRDAVTGERTEVSTHHFGRLRRLVNEQCHFDGAPNEYPELDPWESGARLFIEPGRSN